MDKLFKKEETTMRNNKVIKGIVLGSTVLSMLVGQAGHTDITASAKSIERTADMDLYNENGEVLLFERNYVNVDLMGTQMTPFEEKRKLEGYVYFNQEAIKGYKLILLDSTNSVKKITVDGKKTYKLGKSYKYSEDTYWYGFGGGHGDKLKCKYRIFDTKKLSQGKHTITAKDKHGHETSIKLWNDTKAPKLKVIQKKDKFIIKVSDNGSGIKKVMINGFKTKTYSKRVTSATVTLTKKNWKYFKECKKEGVGAGVFRAMDRVGTYTGNKTIFP